MQQPQSTHPLIRKTLIATLGVSFFAILSNSFFTQILSIPSFQNILSLTSWGINHFLIWQFITYLFIQPIATEGVSFALFLHLFFNLYILWSVGNNLIQIKGVKHFIALFFGGGLFVGLIAYLTLLSSGSIAPLAGSTTSIYILLISCAFLFPDMRVMFFLAIPMQIKWLVFGLIGINLFLDFSNGDFFSFFITTGALVYGYLYSVLIWEVLSPFPKFHKLEKDLIYLKNKILYFFNQQRSSSRSSSNIYNIKTGEAVVKDSAFMDACLEKIARHGKKSLSWFEKWKMWRISKRKNRV